MTTKDLNLLPAGDGIEILTEGGVAGTINIKPCLYDLDEGEDFLNICIMLSEEDEADGDTEQYPDVILYISR